MYVAVDRKTFIKQACLSGICACGFSSIVLSQGLNSDDEKSVEAKDKDILLLREWIAVMLSEANVDLDRGTVKKLIKKTSGVHYNNLKMDDLLAEYKGNLDKFITFLGDKWGWKIGYDKSTRVLIADENKNYCVCPIAPFVKGKGLSAICYCSEGFAEKMFSVVVGTPVKAEVISSIHRGDASCKYKIVY
jgi:hypothetical protein